MHLIALACLCASLTGPTDPPGGDGQAETVTAFVDVTLIPMDRERRMPGQTVLVRGDRIVEIGPVAKVKVPEGGVRVDGKGKFLIPGLAEMHAHIPGGQASDTVVERTLFMYFGGRHYHGARHAGSSAASGAAGPGGPQRAAEPYHLCRGAVAQRE